MTVLPLRAERIRLSRNGALVFVRWNPLRGQFECRFELGEQWQSLRAWDTAAESVLQRLSQSPYTMERM